MDYEYFDECIEAAQALLGSYETTNDLWEANDYVNAAIHLRPKHVGAWMLKSQILSSLEDDAAALAAAEMAINLDPKNAEAQFVRAAVLADMERYQEALHCVEKAFHYINKTDQWLIEDLYYEKAAILEALNRTKDAEAVFEDGLQRCPNSLLLKSGLEPLRKNRIRHSLRIIEGGQI